MNDNIQIKKVWEQNKFNNFDMLILRCLSWRNGYDVGKLCKQIQVRTQSHLYTFYLFFIWNKVDELCVFWAIYFITANFLLFIGKL